MGAESTRWCLTTANWKLCESEGGGFQRVFLTRGSRRTQRAIFEDEAIGDDEETMDEVLLREVRFASKRLAIGDPKACWIADQREALRVKRAPEKARSDQAKLERAELERRLTIAVSTIDMTRAAILPAIMNAIKPKAKRVSPGSSGISACGQARVAIVQCGTNDTYEYIFEDRGPSASSEPHTLKMFLASLRCWSGDDIKDIDAITHEEWGVRRFPCPAGFTPDGLEVLVLAEEANNFVCIDECASSPQIFRVPLKLDWRATTTAVRALLAARPNQTQRAVRPDTRRAFERRWSRVATYCNDQVDFIGPLAFRRSGRPGRGNRRHSAASQT